MHPGLDRPGAVPFPLGLHKQRPARIRECGQDRLERRDTNLKVDASTEGTFERSRHPIAGLADLVQHDLGAVEVEGRKTLVRAVEEHRESAHIAPKSQALVQVGDQEFGKPGLPRSSIIAVNLIVAGHTPWSA